MRVGLVAGLGHAYARLRRTRGLLGGSRMRHLRTDAVVRLRVPAPVLTAVRCWRGVRQAQS